MMCYGLRILNTRPKKQGERLSKLINEAGGVAIDFPTLEIQATKPEWVKSLPNLNEVHQSIFISANAVEYCFNTLRACSIDWPKTIQVIAIGQETQKVLNQNNIQLVHTPEFPDSEHLLALNSLEQLNNQTVLLFKGEGGRRAIEDELIKKNATFIAIDVYKRVLPTVCDELAYSLWHDDAVDIILLTSEQSIHNLFKLFDTQTHTWLKTKTCVVISERLKQVASLYGMQRIIVSHPNQVMQTLFDYKD